MTDLADIRKEYVKGNLDERQVEASPIDQFRAWFDQYLACHPEEPTVMTVATVDQSGQPWQRILLLKGFDETGFVFYTNYLSHKGRQLDTNPSASMHFFWMALERQVQIQGHVEKVSREEAEAYFHSRPLESQLGAWASEQSQPLVSRSMLEQRFEALQQQYEGKQIPLPEYWGGYRLVPSRVEFWQGGAHRLHDRVEYQLSEGGWVIQRLNP